MKAIADFKQQLAELLSDAGFLPPGITIRSMKAMKNSGDGVSESTGAALNSNSSNLKVVRAALVAGLAPNVLRAIPPVQRYQEVAQGTIAVAPDAKEVKIMTKWNERCWVHPRSVNFTEGNYPTQYLIYSQLINTSKLYVTACTLVPPWPLILFGGRLR